MFKIFEKLGGQEAALEALAGAREGKFHGKQPSLSTLKLWKANKRMPGAAVIALQEVCAERGIACEVDDFKAVRHNEAAE